MSGKWADWPWDAMGLQPQGACIPWSITKPAGGSGHVARTGGCGISVPRSGRTLLSL